MEQLVARWAHNPKVTGSSPVPATCKGTGYSALFLLFLIPCLLCMFFTVKNSIKSISGLLLIWKNA